MFSISLPKIFKILNEEGNKFVATIWRKWLYSTGCFMEIRHTNQGCTILKIGGSGLVEHRRDFFSLKSERSIFQCRSFPNLFRWNDWEFFLWEMWGNSSRLCSFNFAFYKECKHHVWNFCIFIVCINPNFFAHQKHNREEHWFDLKRWDEWCLSVYSSIARH